MTEEREKIMVDDGAYDPTLEQTRADIANAWHMLLGISQAGPAAKAARVTNASIPFTLLTGFLGAGKTTLLNNILTHPQGRRIAVIVNDFGAINIDAALVDEEGSTTSTWQLQNGCVCCTLAAGLLGTLAQLLESESPPDHIVLEASGVAEPMGVIQTVLGRRDLRLGGVICLVDAEAVRAHRQMPGVLPTLERQLKYADLILLNKIDIASREDRASTAAWLASAAPRGVVIEAVHAAVPSDIVLGFSTQGIALEEKAFDLHEDRFESIALTTLALVDEKKLADFGTAMPPGVLRAKGLLRTTSDPSRTTLFQYVGRRWSLHDSGGSTRTDSVLVLIGLKGEMDAAALGARFDACTLP